MHKLAMEYINLKMETDMKVNSCRVNFKEKVLTFTKMEDVFKDLGKKIFGMDMENFSMKEESL